MNIFISAGKGSELITSLLKRILTRPQRSVSIFSVAKVLNISAEDIMIILSCNGVNIGTGYLTRLTETHLDILWKVFSRKLNGYVTKSFRNITKTDESEFNELYVFYNHYKKHETYSGYDNVDIINDFTCYYQSDKSEIEKPLFYSEIFKNQNIDLKYTIVDEWFNVDSDKLKEAFLDLIYQEDRKLSQIELQKDRIDERQILLSTSMPYLEVITDKDESRTILSKIINRLSFKIKIKVRKIYNFILSIIILIIISCRYYIFACDDEHPKMTQLFCASFG